MTMHIIARNDPCPCGSGKRYKHCCGMGGAVGGRGTVPLSDNTCDKAEGLADSDSLDEVFSRAMKLHQEGQLDRAANLYRQIICADPGHADALHYLGVCSYQRGEHSEAVRLIDSALAIRDGTAMAYNNRGLALQALGRSDEALASYDMAIRQNPADATAYNNRGLLCHEMKRFDAALRDYDLALSVHPDFAVALNNRGRLLMELHRYTEALDDINRSITSNPAIAKFHTNRGNVLRKLRRSDEAIASYDQALALMPNDPESHVSRGNLLWEQQRFSDALASYDQALRLQPDNVSALYNRGSALSDLHRYHEAMSCYDRVLAIKPDDALALANRGSVLQELRRHAEAVDAFEAALSIRTDLPYLLGSWIFSKMHVCQWQGLDDAYDQVLREIKNNKQATRPLTMLAIPSSPRLQMLCARNYAESEYNAFANSQFTEKRRGHDRIRIGYFSADFRQHPVANLIAEMIERHDRARFEAIAFSFGPVTTDEWRKRLERAFDRFIDVGGMSDHDLAMLARELEVDIAVDLMGYTHNARTGIFSFRPAPISVNYLGYPGTMGADYIDYIMTDRIVVPEEHAEYYTEKIVRLPHSFFPNDSTKSIADEVPDRVEQGLPAKGFVFCAFNKANKITPDLFEIWMRLLTQVKGSVLWLSVGDGDAQANLRREAGERGVSPERLVFARRVDSLADHLARHRLADLFLDTFYYNAHTTASDALWAGLPVLTCLGNTFAGRVAASLLSAIDLPELITSTHEEYQALALSLATEPERLDGIRQKLAEHRRTSPLFNTPLFTQHIEAAYEAMHARQVAGLPPDNITVEP